jgi:hypothetical protein
VAEVERTDIGGGRHPKGAVDSEIARIASEAVTAPKGPTTTEAVAVLSVHVTTRAEELEV